MHLRIGGNQEEDILKARIEEYGLQKMVTFEGFVSGDKKIECLNWADAYILPSFNEGLPIGILEAMSYGDPIISSPVGGIPEVVKDGVNGCMVEPGNSEEIAAAILKFVQNKELIRLYGQESLRLVQPYLPETVFESLTKIYNQLIA